MGTIAMQHDAMVVPPRDFHSFLLMEVRQSFLFLVLQCNFLPVASPFSRAMRDVNFRYSDNINYSQML